MKTLVIYHGKCLDGFTAAWCAWRLFGDFVEYLPAAYVSQPPDVTGRDVYIVDFSYPRAQLLEMHAKADSLRVLDHHKTAQADLDGLDFCTFDMNRSGAGMAWDEFYPGQPRPALVDYVEDRDLWRFKLPMSKEVNAYIGSYDLTFDNWNTIARAIEEDLGGVVNIGSALLRAVDRYVKEMSAVARMRVIDGHTVPVVNAPYINTSELVGYLAEQNSDAPFAAAWYQSSAGFYKYSLRSRGANGADVSAIAKQFGGGGHKNAAGFSVPMRVDGAV